MTGAVGSSGAAPGDAEHAVVFGVTLIHYSRSNNFSWIQEEAKTSWSVWLLSVSGVSLFIKDKEREGRLCHSTDHGHPLFSLAPGAAS